MADILVADDTPSIRNTLSILLAEEGHTVRLAANGEEALAEYAKRRPDMLLLDIMMPKKNGYRVLKQIRQNDPSLPIIFLSAKGAPADVAMGLNLGSDDYLPKPFDREVLLSRIRAVFRRTRGTAPAAVAPVPPPVPDRALAATGDFKIGPYRVDVKRFALVDAKGREEALSFREIQVLRRLAEHPGEVISRDSLLNEFWGGGVGGNTRTVDQYVMKVRRKLGRAADCIETIHGIGYRYLAPATP